MSLDHISARIHSSLLLGQAICHVEHLRVSAAEIGETQQEPERELKAVR